ncbi:MAG TPA: hypothetical protein VKA46_33755 [Gemmataceae bacterium]|nr:hypothetical protein [Gemmataceae bacterium]
MTSLEDAWRWYEKTRSQLRRMKRLAQHYWTELPWEGRLERDDHFQLLQAGQVEEEAAFGLLHLDDLAIVVLFSVFESLVRHRILAEVIEESKVIRHRTLKLAAEEARERVEEGSFFHVLQPFKDHHADLVEEVNQVRRYRNRVAHGRRGQESERVDPQLAYGRLQRFLAAMAQSPAGSTPP